MRARAALAALAVALGLAFGGGVAAAQEEHTEEHSEELTHEAEECIHVLEDGGDPEDCHEAPSPILPEANEIIWGGGAFLVLLLAMWKFAYPAIKDGMDARAQRIRDSLDEAERTRTEAQTILEEYQAQLADAKNESARIIEEARQTAEQMRRDLMARAEAEVRELRERTEADLIGAQDRALGELRSRVAQLAIGAAEVVVQKNLDPETNRALVERFIEQVGSA